MAKGYLILNASSVVVATHKWGSTEDRPCPIVPETNGSVVNMTEEGLDEIVSLMIGGQEVKVVSDGDLWVAGAHIGTIVDGKVVFL